MVAMSCRPMVAIVSVAIFIRGGLPSLIHPASREQEIKK